MKLMPKKVTIWSIIAIVALVVTVAPGTIRVGPRKPGTEPPRKSTLYLVEDVNALTTDVRDADGRVAESGSLGGHTTLTAHALSSWSHT
jgi:hypothetical protein